MGLLVNGEWHDRWYETDKSEGRFVRDAAAFRTWVTADGSPGPTGTGGLQPAELLASPGGPDRVLEVRAFRLNSLHQAT